MLAYALIVLFTGTGVLALTTLAFSYSRAFAALGDLRAAIKHCEEDVLVTIRIIDHARTTAALPAPLRLVSSQSRPAIMIQQDGLRAAA